MHTAVELEIAQVLEVDGAPDLTTLLHRFGNGVPPATARDPLLVPAPTTERGAALSADFAAVNGQAQASRAVEIAAAGDHHLLLFGPPRPTP